MARFHVLIDLIAFAQMVAALQRGRVHAVPHCIMHMKGPPVMMTSRTIRSNATALVVIGLLLLLLFLYVIVTSEARRRIAEVVSVSVGRFASVVASSPVDDGTLAINPSGLRCPGPLDSDDDADRLACQPVLKGNTESKPPRRTVITTATYLARAQNCDCFRSDLGYLVSLEDTTDDERRFPIAFSLLTYENLEQTERLLRLIYRPHNVYCIHVDAKSPPELRHGLEAIAKCFDNVFAADPPVSVHWGKISVVHAEMLCMRQLLQVHHSWKYFINLVGRDMPLRTNHELV